MSFNALKDYRESAYVESIDDFQPDKTRYKFNSPNQFVSVMEELHNSGRRFSNLSASKDGDYGFSGSYSMDDALSQFRGGEFDTAFAKRAAILVNQMRQRMEVKDEGDEISIPDYLSKGDYFIKYGTKSYKRPVIIDIPLIIEVTYLANEDQAEMLEVGKRILTALYQLKVKCPKIVFAFITERGFIDERTGNYVDGHAVYVECNFTDFNAFSKMVIPATFRRLWCRIAEMHKGLQYGYGGRFTGAHTTLEEGISLMEYKHTDIEGIKKSLEQKARDYARRSSMAKTKSLEI